jgi:hypothetical protein
MIVALYIYVDGIAKRIELFEDEKISITSSIQNINNISKVFTDYSQSFTIPASATNNEIFRHWYENSLDNAFDQRLRYDGYIEIDTQVFRIGRWQLESASIKNNRIENYKITFYGNLKSLSDKFKEDKLKDIEEINNYSFGYSGANVLSIIKSTSAENVMFPFISSKRIWNIGTSGASTDNINSNGHALNYKELFPAVRIKSIFDSIQQKYGFNFSGTFLNDKRFTDAYLWFKNGEQKELSVIGTPGILEFTGTDFINTNYFTTSVANNSIKLSQQEPFNQAFVRLQFTLSTTVTFNFLIAKNGVIDYNTSQTFTGNSFNSDIYIDNSELGVEYSFYIATSDSVVYTGDVSAGAFDASSFDLFVVPLNSITGNTVNLLDLTKLAPDMKVTDFFSGVLKAFNLTAFSEDGINFTIEQLENWYYLGNIKDFSEYTISDFDFERIKSYRKIDFKYQKSESVLNKRFFDNNQREYGDLGYTFENDGGDYSIQLPFENITFNRFYNFFQVGYAVKSDLNSYIPKPVILYRYGLQSASYHFDTGVSKTIQSFYNAFGQETLYNGFKHSINFGLEISTYDLTFVNNSLYTNYYLAYLNNLYSLKSRMVKVKMRLPYLELLNLKLNDRIVIRDKRYIINQFTTDLTTFEVNFELIQDFRSVNFSNSKTIEINNQAQIVKADIVSTVNLNWTIDSDPNNIINSINSQINFVEVNIKSNPSGSSRFCTLKSDSNDIILIQQNA